MHKLRHFQPHTVNTMPSTASQPTGHNTATHPPADSGSPHHAFSVTSPPSTPQQSPTLQAWTCSSPPSDTKAPLLIVTTPPCRPENSQLAVQPSNSSTTTHHLPPSTNTMATAESHKPCPDKSTQLAAAPVPHVSHLLGCYPTPTSPDLLATPSSLSSAEPTSPEAPLLFRNQLWNATDSPQREEEPVHDSAHSLVPALGSGCWPTPCPGQAGCGSSDAADADLLLGLAADTADACNSTSAAATPSPGPASEADSASTGTHYSPLAASQHTQDAATSYASPDSDHHTQHDASMVSGAGATCITATPRTPASVHSPLTPSTGVSICPPKRFQQALDALSTPTPPPLSGASTQAEAAHSKVPRQEEGGGHSRVQGCANRPVEHLPGGGGSSKASHSLQGGERLHRYLSQHCLLLDQESVKPLATPPHAQDMPWNHERVCRALFTSTPCRQIKSTLDPSNEAGSNAASICSSYACPIYADLSSSYCRPGGSLEQQRPYDTSGQNDLASPAKRIGSYEASTTSRDAAVPSLWASASMALRTSVW